MAIFDNELIDNKANRDSSIRIPNLASPNPPIFGTPSGAPLNPGGFYEDSLKYTGMTIAELSQIPESSKQTFNSPFSTVTGAVLKANKKYPLYQRGYDLENIYGLQQSVLGSLGNGLLKAGATTLGTFAQSFGTIPNTIKALKEGVLTTGDISALSGDPDGYEASIDQWLKNMEDYFPNYYTREERAHPFRAMIPFMPGSSNFWGDKIIKNLGFTAGTIAGVWAQDAIITAVTGGIGTIPVLGTQVASKLGKAALWMNKLFVTETRVDKLLKTANVLGKTSKQISALRTLGELATARKLTNGVRYGMNMFGAGRTEAAIEARDGRIQVRDELLRLHELENLGVPATGADLAEIEKLADDAMNTRFGINLAILTVSNIVQFDNLFRSFAVANRGVTSGVSKAIQGTGKKAVLQEGSLDVFETVGAKGIKEGLWRAVKPQLPLMFSEGVWEEGGQYAAEKGTFDYYTRKYKDPSVKSNKEAWDYTSEAVSSTLHGLSEQFGTDEGLEQMIIGAISAIITGGALQRFDSVKGKGKKARMQQAITALNKYGLTGILHNKFADTADSVAIAKQMKAAAKKGDIYEYKNLKEDLFHVFVTSRLPVGMHDVTIEQLKMLKDLSKEQFENTFGMDFNSSNKSTVSEYVDNLIDQANNIKDITDVINETFINPFKNIANPDNGTAKEKIEAGKFLSFELWKKELGYFTATKDNVLSRLNSMQERLHKINPELNIDLVAKVSSDKGLKELSEEYEEESNRLNKTILPDSSVKYKRETKEKVKTLRTAAELINLTLSKKNVKLNYRVFADTLNFELNKQTTLTSPKNKQLDIFNQDNSIGIEHLEEIAKIGVDSHKLITKKVTASEQIDLLTSDEGFAEYFAPLDNLKPEDFAPKKEGEKVTPEKEEEEIKPTFKNNFGEDQEIEINREYESTSTTKTKVRKSGDRFKITAPDGTITFQKTREEAKKEAADIDAEFNNLGKVKVLGLNDDGTVKIIDLSGNIYNISPEQLAGYIRVETEQDRLLKKKEELGKIQDELTKTSATVGTIDNYIPEKEGRLKAYYKLYTSTITEFEDGENFDPTKSEPHIRRSRNFLNNISFFKNADKIKAILITAKLAKSLGLEGIVQTSYGVDIDTPISEIAKKKFVNDPLDKELGFVAAVFVIQEGNKIYFVDENGNKLTQIKKQADLNKVIFQTMPTTELYYTGDDKRARFRKEEEAEARAQSLAWKDFREDLFDLESVQSLVLYPFIVSQGIGIVDKSKPNETAKNPVSVLNISQDIIENHEGLLIIPTTGTIAHNGENKKFLNGVPVLQYGSILQSLNNKIFSKDEAKTIYEVLKSLSEDIVTQSESGAPLRLDREYVSFLQNVLYWRKGKPEGNNQIRLNVEEMSVELGDKAYPIAEITDYEDEILEKLSTAYNSVNNTTLKDKFSEPFFEYYVDKEGKLVDAPIEWENYQTYLLSDKTPNGDFRKNGIPLTTDIAPRTDSIPYNYKQKYATLLGMKFVVPVVETVETKPTESGTKALHIGGHVIDGKTINKFKAATKDGKDLFVGFTAAIDPDGSLSVTVADSDPIVKDTSISPGAMSGIKSFLIQWDKDAVEKGAEPNTLYNQKNSDLLHAIIYYETVIKANLITIRKENEEVEDTEEDKKKKAEEEALKKKQEEDKKKAEEEALKKKQEETLKKKQEELDELVNILEYAKKQQEEKSKPKEETPAKVKEVATKKVVEEEVKKLTEEETKAVEEEKDDKESIAEYLVKAVNNVVTPISKVVKDIVARIRKRLISFFIGLAIISSISAGTAVRYSDSINKYVGENFNKDVANLFLVSSLSDAIEVGGNIIEKVIGIGKYAETVSSVDNIITSIKNDTKLVEEDVITKELVYGPEEEVKPTPAFTQQPINLGKSVYTEDGLSVTPYIIDMSNGEVKIQLATNTYAPNKHNFQRANNAYGIMGATHAEFVSAKKMDKNYPIQLVFNPKNGAIQFLETSKVASYMMVQPLTKHTMQKVSNLAITRNDKGGFNIKTALDGANGTTILATKDDGSFHIGLASGSEKKPILQSQNINSYRTLRGGMVVFGSSDAEISVAVSGSPNDIFSTLIKLQDKYPDKEFYIFRGDTGSYSSSAMTSTGVVTLKDVRLHSNQNVWGDNEFWVLKKEQPVKENDSNIPALLYKLSALLAVLRKKRQGKGKFTKKEIEELEKSIADLQFDIENLQRRIKGEPEIIKSVDGEVKPGKFSGTKPPKSSRYRRVGKDGRRRMTDAEFQLFQQWHRENAPYIPFEVLYNIISINDTEKAWGVFEDGVAKFVRGGLRGVEYHEIGHGIWRGMLSPEEQQAIIADEKSRGTTFLDKASGKRLEYDTATDRQIEERIMDDFMEFRIGKLPIRSLGDLVRRLFSIIIDFFKRFSDNPSLKSELFKAIDSGEFKERKLNPNVDYSQKAYSVDGLTTQQSHEFTQDMVARAAQIIYREGKKALLFTEGGLTGKEIFDEIRREYSSTEEADDVGITKIQKLGDRAFIQLTEKVKIYLRPLGIQFTDEDLVSINDEETSDKYYTPDPFEGNFKNQSPTPIKFALATLVKTKATNQENKISLTIPEEAISKEANGFLLLNFSQVFATLINSLSNTGSISKAVEKVKELAKYDPNYVRMFMRLGGDITDKGIPIMPFEKFKIDDWRFFIQFMQTFLKQKPEALIQYKVESATHTASADLFTASKEIQSGWFENIKLLAQRKDSYIKFNKETKTFQVKSFKGIVEINTSGKYRALPPSWKPGENFKVYDTQKEALTAAKKLDIPINTPQNMIDFLGLIGINFTLDEYNNLKSKKGRGRSSQQVRFAKAVSSLYSYFGNNKDLISLTRETLEITGPLSTLSELLVKSTNPNQDNVHYGVDGKKRQSFSNNNYPSTFANDFNEVNTLEELFDRRPELRDLYSNGSQVLKKGGLFFDKKGNRIKNIRIAYIGGTKDTVENRGKATTLLSKGERFSQEINQNLRGDYYIMIPADGSTEWMMDMGNHFTFTEYESQRKTAWNKVGGIYSIFRGYLIDEVALALDYENRKHNANLKIEDEKKNPRGRKLRIFKDILSTRVLNHIHDMITKNKTQTEIKTYIDKNIDDINTSVRIFLENSTDRTFNLLLDKQEIVIDTIFNSKGEEIPIFNYKNLDNDFAIHKDHQINKNELSETTVKNIIGYANVNYVINMIEYHKIFFGDPYQFKSDEDATKRYKSFFSPRVSTFNTPEYNTWLNDELNIVNGRKLTKTDPGYHKHKDYANTVTFTDFIIAGSLRNIIPAYGKTDMTDGMAWLMDVSYREIKNKHGKWDLNGDQEKWHQWQMAWTRQNLPKGMYQYKDPSLEKHDKILVSKPEPRHNIEVLKPIVSGNKHGKNQFDIVLDKFAQMPVYYSMVKGTNLERLYIKMWKEKVDYAIVQQGRKVGQEDTQPLYTPENNFNEDVFSNPIKVSWKSYGIQVETEKEGGPKVQTMGSQITKIASIDLYENGEPVSAAAKEAYEYSNRILGELHQNAYNNILKEFGIEDRGDHFYMKDGIAISKTLLREMLKRKVSENTIDTIELDVDNQFNIPFEASPAYVQIRNILFSIIDKGLVHPKVNGGPHVQVSSAMFELALENRGLVRKNSKGNWEEITKEKYNSLSAEEKKKVLLTDSTLSFYSREDPYCEIMLPHWFKKQLDKLGNKTEEELLHWINNSKDGKEILKGIGFRIPSQALSSIEVFRVKGFLPQYMGGTVVVPAEITTKAGSDFDIDKLNMYLKSIWIDSNGNVHLIKYKGSEEETKSFYGMLFDKGELLTAKQTKSLNRLLEENEITEEIDKLLLAVFQENGVLSEEDITEEFTTQLSEYGIKETVVNTMYKKALENEYFAALEKVITMPENFDNLISPVNDAGLKDLSIFIKGLKGIDDSGIKNKLLDRVYMTSLRHSFSMGKKWIGVVATAIPQLSLRQKSKVYIDTRKIPLTPEIDQKFLGTGSIILEHNKLTIDGEEFTSLSGRTVADKNSEERISSRLSGHGTAVVDVARDDFITDLIESDLVIGLTMFLESIGVGGKPLFLFLHQPIISQYLSLLDSISSRYLYDGRFIDIIKSKFLTDEKSIENTELSIDNLEEDIKSYYQRGYLNVTQNANQLKILDEFLKYAKMAEYNLDLVLATNYDTSKFRSAETLTRKIDKTKKSENVNIITSAENILNSTHLGKQKALTERAIGSLSAVFKLDQLSFKYITDKVLKPYGENKFLSADEYENIALRIKTSFLDYIIHTKLGLHERIEELLIDPETSVASKLEKAKIAHPNIELLKNLEITSGQRMDGTKSIKLRVNLKDPYDENLYIGMMRELRDNDDQSLNELYHDLITVSLLQGTYTSPISIRNIIPLEDYSNLIAPIISQLTSGNEFEMFAEGFFERNNFKDDSIVKTYSPMFFINENITPSIQVTDSGNWFADISEYTASVFQDELRLGVRSNDRRIMFLDEKYNQANIKHDYIKIPRIITNTNTKEKVDMLMGITITPLDFVRMKKRGDHRLKNFFGYKKVRHITGEPLIVKKQKKQKGEWVVTTNYVYKLVNFYGDGERASEYKQDLTPSKINNGTIRTQEFTDEKIVSLYGGQLKDRDIATGQVDNIVGLDSLKQTTSLIPPNRFDKEFNMGDHEMITSFFKKGNKFFRKVAGEMYEDGMERTEEISEEQYNDAYNNTNISPINQRGKINESQPLIPKVGDIVTLEFNIKDKIVDSKVRIDKMESYFHETIRKDKDNNIIEHTKYHAGYSLDLTNMKSGKKYSVVVGNDGYISQFLGANNKLKVGTDNYILEFDISKTDKVDISEEEKEFKDIGKIGVETVDREIQVEQYKIFIKPDGRMFYKNGNELLDQTTKNKVNIRKELQDGTLRTATYNKSNYFILSDDRIIGSGKSNLGKESVQDQKIKEMLLLKAVLYKKEC